MAATFMHVGIPVTNKKPEMVYNENMKLWKNNDVDLYDYKIEYLKYEEGTPFPEILHRNPHVAYKVDDMDRYVEQADRAIWGPVELRPGFRLAFVEMDNTLFELVEDKN